MRDKRRVLLCIVLLPVLCYTFIMFRAIERTCPLETLSDDYSGLGERRRSLASHDTLKDLQDLRNNFQDGSALDLQSHDFKHHLHPLSYRDSHARNKMLSAYANANPDWRPFRISKARYVINCTNIHEIKILKKVGHGVSKQAFLGEYKGMHVAVKMVTRHLHDVKACIDDLKKHNIDTPGRQSKCFVLPTMKLMKEILFLEQIEHPNLVKLLGYCVRSEESDSTDISEHGVVSVYEFGYRFVVDSLQILPWQTKLQHAVDMASLLEYLENSPLGSLVVPDFKEGHFLLVNSTIKMIDMDDVHNTEPQCGPFVRSQNPREHNGCDYNVKCRMAQCIGFNGKVNLKNMNKLIFKRLLLPLSFPERIIRQIGQISAKLDSLEISASELRSQLQNLQNSHDHSR